MGYVSIFLGLAAVICLMMRRWSPLMVGIAAAAVVIFMNGFPYGETMMTTFFDGFCTSFQSLFPLIFSGSLLAQVYNRSGAVNAVGDMIANALFKEDAGATRKYVSCILAMALASGALAFCGLNALVTLMAMYPIALRLMERANVPKRFVMGILSCGVYTFAMSAPGSAETVNILAMQAVAERGNPEELHKIVRDATDAFERSKNISTIGNPVVDALLNQYLHTAEENGIKVTLDVTIPEVLSISPLSLSILIGNTFDNAIEACSGLPPEQRKIHLQLRKQYRSLFYRLDNPYSDISRSLRVGSHHGYGLKNVKRVVRESDGDFYAEKKNGTFTVKVRLNCEN